MKTGERYREGEKTEKKRVRQRGKDREEKTSELQDIDMNSDR